MHRKKKKSNINSINIKKAKNPEEFKMQPYSIIIEKLFYNIIFYFVKKYFSYIFPRVKGNINFCLKNMYLSFTYYK